MYLLVGLLMIAMAAYVILPLLAKSKVGSSSSRTSSTTTTTSKTTNNSRLNTDFQKEGTLQFIKDGQPIKSVDIEVSESDAERNQGLMYRQGMLDGQAMLFIFDQSKPQSFWMKNTYIALDIIYADENKRIVSIGKNTQPLSKEPVLSRAPAMYVVEVPAGFTTAYNIEPGDEISYQID